MTATPTTATSNADRLRALLQAPELVCVPTCFDALSARLVANAGFPATFMSGFAVAAARYGLPDFGLISLTEMLDQLRTICTAVPGFPVIGDGDTGFGNALNVRRTVAEYARAGAACIMLEDQVAPKRCGHFEGKLVISAGEARMKVRAAVEVARTEGILVLARTDARAVLGFEAALERCRAFEAEGADIVFMEAPETERELHDFAQAMKVPTMANMVAGGKTPILSRSALQSMGIKMAVYHPLLFSAVHAMNDALDALKADRMPAAAASFDDVKNLVGVPEYSELALRYGEYE